MFDRSKIGFIGKWSLALDKKILTMYFILLVLGCVFIFSSSVSVANRINISNYYFFKNQLKFSIISVFIVLFLSVFNRDLLRKNTILIFLISLVLLMLVPLIGFQTKGAKRWIYIFGISLQPTEILKPTIILLNAFLLEKFTVLKEKKYLFITLASYVFCIFFIYKQPDIGTLILITTVFFAQIFLTDFINFKKILLAIPVFMLFFVIIYSTMPHVSGRINNFLTSIKNPDKANYQVKRSIIAYQNAGLFGEGFMEGEIKNFIPDVHTDFIFPAITEEFGFVIVFCMLCLYFYTSVRIMLKAYLYNSKDTFTFLSLFGLSLLFVTQTSINIGVSLNLLPTKGMTLPFLSYGGSSIVGSSVLIGFVLILCKNTYLLDIKTEDVLDLSCFNDIYR